MAETILVVDDEPEVLALCSEALTMKGYTVLTTEDPKEALGWARSRLEPIHLLVTDVMMPLMNGTKLAEQYRPLRPESKILFMSGASGEDLQKSGVRLSFGEPFLTKPFSVADLATKVRAALDYRPPISKPPPS
jgi:DNA-binding response OmpR family regulator